MSARLPWRVEIDQASHGDKLAIVNSDGDIVARTPVGVRRDQAISDAKRAALICKAVNCHETFVELAKQVLDYAENGTAILPGALLVDEFRSMLVIVGVRDR